MAGHICYSVKNKCWNLRDSYGEICVHCGCCSDDKKTRYESRLEVSKRWLEEEKNFSLCGDTEVLRELQRKNISSNIEYDKRRIRYYERKLKELELRHPTGCED